ncbi:MAG: exo-alpha-sialidase [Clostridia bacterium]|nr:exo-alpha-sialidase [Clostridia bacterium]
MKRIGKEVHLIPRVDGNLRNGEGAFLRLKDGRILYAYTKYYGEGWDDDNQAFIAACYSSDEGESFTESVTFYEKPESAKNIMSASLLRMENGDLGLIYLQKTETPGRLICMPYLVRSSDEGKTFGDPLPMIEEPGYYVLLNDHVLRTENGRIIFAVADHVSGTAGSMRPGIIKTYYSDDDGKSFKKSPSEVLPPYNDSLGLAEPGIYALADGRLWLYMRTGYGYQYQSFSEDGGLTWSEVKPNHNLTSSSSPMIVRKAGSCAIAVLNPIPWAGTFGISREWLPHKDRTPFVLIADPTGGEALVKQDFSSRVGEFMPYVRYCYYLEDDRSETYCYPSLIEVEGGLLVAYYFSDGSGKELASARIKKIRWEELGLPM